MSIEDVEAVRAYWEAFSSLDGARADALLDPDVVYIEDPAFPGAGEFRGREAMTARFHEYGEIFGEGGGQFSDAEIEDGRHAVLLRFTHRSRGQASGAPVEKRWSYVINVRGGLVLRLQAFMDPGEARRVAGTD